MERPGNLILTERFPRPSNGHSGEPVFNVQHQHDYQEKYRIDENKLHVGVIGQAEELVEGDAAFFGASAKLKAKKVGAGAETPFGPPVKVSQLFSTRRMISPNPSVTMAR